jgi:hypothetical protein
MNLYLQKDGLFTIFFIPHLLAARTLSAGLFFKISCHYANLTIFTDMKRISTLFQIPKLSINSKNQNCGLKRGYQAIFLLILAVR